MPDQQLLPAAVLDQRRRAVARLAGGEGPPDLAARAFVQRHRHAARAADQAVQDVADDQRMPRHAPERRRSVVVLDEVLAPQRAARSGPPGRSSCLRRPTRRPGRRRWSACSAARRDRTGCRAAGIRASKAADRSAASRHSTRSAPSSFSRAPGLLSNSPVRGVVQHVDFAVGDGGAGVAQSHGGAPQDGQTRGRKPFDDALLAPHAVPARAQPLRPVVRHTGGRTQQDRRPKELATRTHWQLAPSPSAHQHWGWKTGCTPQARPFPLPLDRHNCAYRAKRLSNA